ncbi:inverse autotransporter beta domain-containing protein (plasmid) [Enterobacter asburiae]
MQNTVVRRTALATLVVQLLSPLSLAFTPAIASAVQPPRDTTAPADVNDSQAAQRLAQAASRAGTFLSNSPDSDAAASLARGAAAGHATAEVQQWLSQFGTARTTIDVDKDFSLKGSSLDLLVPLYDSPDLLTFAQGGIRRADDRTQSSLGLGVRSFRADSMLGASAFIDHDLSRSHTRAGLGLEYWRDNLRLGANSYMRLSGWKDSPDVTDYLERPANGWDITARGWLPSLPQLGASLGFERYYGEEVGLFGHNNRQKDPYAATAGLNWTPFPLLTLNAEQRQGKGSASDSRVGLELRYTPGVSWSQQTSPDAVAAMRSLAGGRMDLVERNNNMVLEYKKKEVITLKAQEQVTGYAGEQKPLSVELKSKYPVERIEWSAPELEAAGGIIMSSGPRSHSVTLPAWKAGGESANTYTVRGVAVDSRGNRSGESRTRVTVSQAAISPALSGLSLSSVQLVPDGTDAQTVTLTLLDASGNPVDADESEIVVERADAAGKKAKRAGGSRAQVTPFVRTGAGVYDLTVTAGTEAERFTLTPYVRGYSAGAIEVDIRQRVSETNSSMTVSSATTDTGTPVTVTLTLRDDDNLPLDGQVVAFSSQQEGVTFDPVQAAADGVYTTVMRAVRPGAVTVSAVVNGVTLPQPQVQVTVNAGAASEAASAISTDEELYSSGDTMTLTVSLSDVAGNPVGGVTLQDTDVTVGGAQAADPQWTDNGDGTYTRAYTAQNAGTGQKATLKLNGWSEAVESTTYDISTGAASEATSAISTDTALYASGNTMTLTVSLSDAAGNPVAGATLQDADVTVEGAQAADPQWTDNGDGTYTRAYTAETAGTGQKATLKLNGWSAAVETASYEITAGNATESASSIDMGSSAFRIGESTTVKVVLKDSWGNADTVVKLEESMVHIPNATASSPHWQDNGKGTWSRQYIMDTTGTGLTATLSGLPGWTGSVTSPAYRIAGDVDSSASSFTPSQDRATYNVNEEIEMTLVLNDAGGIPVSGINLHDAVIPFFSVLSWEDMNDGNYKIRIKGLFPGSLPVSVSSSSWNGSITMIKPSFLDITNSLIADENKSSISLSSAYLVNGQEFTVTVEYIDSFGGFIAINDSDIDVEVPNARPSDVAWLRLSGSKFQRKYIAENIGKGLKVVMNRKEFSTPVYSTEFVIGEGADYSESYIELDKNSHASYERIEATVYLFEKSKKPVIGYNIEDLEVSSLGLTAIDAAWKDNRDGSYTRIYQGEKYGSMGLLMKLRNWASSKLVLTTVKGLPVSEKHTSISTDISDYQAGDDIKVTITMRDADGDITAALEDPSFTVTVPNAKEKDTEWVKSPSGVEWTKIYTAETPGINLNVILSDVPGWSGVVHSGSYNVIGEPDEINSSLTLNEAMLYAGDHFTLELTLKDSNGLPVRDFDVKKSNTVVDGSSEKDTAWTYLGDGMYKRTYIAQKAGDALNAKFIFQGWNSFVESSQYSIVPGESSEYQSTIEISRDVLNSGETFDVTVTVKDKFGNVIKRVSPPGSAQLFVPGATAFGSFSGNQDGSFTRSYIARTPVTNQETSYNATYKEDNFSSVISVTYKVIP